MDVIELLALILVAQLAVVWLLAGVLQAIKAVELTVPPAQVFVPPSPVTFPPQATAGPIVHPSEHDMQVSAISDITGNKLMRCTHYDLCREEYVARS